MSERHTVDVFVWFPLTEMERDSFEEFLETFIRHLLCHGHLTCMWSADV